MNAMKTKRNKEVLVEIKNLTEERKAMVFIVQTNKKENILKTIELMKELAGKLLKEGKTNCSIKIIQKEKEKQTKNFLENKLVKIFGFVDFECVLKNDDYLFFEKVEQSMAQSVKKQIISMLKAEEVAYEIRQEKEGGKKTLFVENIQLFGEVFSFVISANGAVKLKEGTEEKEIELSKWRSISELLLKF